MILTGNLGNILTKNFLKATMFPIFQGMLQAIFYEAKSTEARYFRRVHASCPDICLSSSCCNTPSPVDCIAHVIIEAC
jgi:hypothetical protein